MLFSLTEERIYVNGRGTDYDLFIHSMPKGAFLASCFRDGKSDPPFLYTLFGESKEEWVGTDWARRIAREMHGYGVLSNTFIWDAYSKYEERFRGGRRKVGGIYCPVTTDRIRIAFLVSFSV